MISIIVPVHNAEQYLRSCIESLLNQTVYDEYEILLVENCSSDMSPIICDQFAQKYSQIISTHVKISGVSNARNVGIGLAKGEYIGFVDADDFVEPTMFQELMDSMVRYGSDMSICGFLRDENGTIIPHVPAKEECIDLYSKGVEWFDIAYKDLLLQTVWNKLFKKELIQNVFDTCVHRREDTLFVFEYIKNCKKVSCINKELYHYCYRESSVTSNVKFDNDRINVVLRSYYLAEELIATFSNGKTNNNFIYHNCVDEIMSALELLVDADLLTKNKIEIIRDYKSSDGLRRFITDKRPGQLWFINLCPYALFYTVKLRAAIKRIILRVIKHPIHKRHR